MGVKVEYTPTSHIKNALRLLTMRCRERQHALKAAERRCAVCGAKHSRAAGRHVTVEAHHVRQPDWARVVRVIREEVLQTAAGWRALCRECHGKEHKGGGE